MCDFTGLNRTVSCWGWPPPPMKRRWALLLSQGLRHRTHRKLRSASPQCSHRAQKSPICVPDRSLPERHCPKIPALCGTSAPVPPNQAGGGRSPGQDWDLSARLVSAKMGPKFPALLGVRTLQCGSGIPDLCHSCALWSTQQDGEVWAAPRVWGRALTLHLRWERPFLLSQATQLSR